MKEKSLILITWLVSLTATLSSLYFSEVKNFIPCELCWYQRILMYPLVIILGLSLNERDRISKKYILMFSIPGACLSFYHYLIQKTSITSFCSLESECTGTYINWLGFVTIPFLAFIAFLLISFFTILQSITVKKAILKQSQPIRM
ncbi:disulfide bond formation protein B [Lysinibacillus agricola]|uniref:Probable disulfide formation protein n=1 Tax=Lysinibacillus agricola TaxID=2590012 RepID=A0ABX7ARP8_9BACI|nr:MULTISPECIES: disulfide oxidoreductase [Lysinibacillus]QQP12202.1 disulfide bond formation protein B [Lysinibacillus agricola]